MAIMHNNLTNKWIIKSFKRSTDANPTMQIALEKAGSQSQK
jgi:hypothetical protein